MQRAWTWLVMMGVLAQSHVWAADGGAGAVFTNKVRFRIPFRYDPAEMQRLQAREVQLFVSTDRGGRWRMVDRVEPRSEHFDFLAPGDGEYWFAVRTLDTFNRLHPQGTAFEPALKVTVDATPPVLELTLTELEPGKVELRWTAADDHIDSTKLRLEYRQPDSPDWQQVGVIPEPNGQTTWALQTGGLVAVRGSIGDLAGNTTSTEKELTVHTPRPDSKNSKTEYRAPVAANPEPIPAAAASNDLPRELSSQSPPEPRPSRGTPAAPGRDLNNGGDFFDPAPGTGPQIQPKVKENLVSDSPLKHAGPLQKPQFATEAMPSSADPDTPQSSAAGSGPPAAPAAAEPRTIVVNNRDFQIGYRVDEVGPSGVGKVELFITQDEGRKWYRYGIDPDMKSPFAVHVPEDGIYGFEIRVKNGAGLGDDPPRPGEAPTIRVTVDQTPPTAQLLPPQVGRGKSRNKVLLRWTAADANLGPAPILLEYSEHASGPWQTIADWQANSGRYIWSVGKGLPGKVYLRLTAKDAAGNTMQSATSEPLLIDFTRPTARIVDIEAKTAEPPRN